jgi:hypothetical protein
LVRNYDGTLFVFVIIKRTALIGCRTIATATFYSKTNDDTSKPRHGNEVGGGELGEAQSTPD